MSTDDRKCDAQRTARERDASYVCQMPATNPCWPMYPHSQHRAAMRMHTQHGNMCGRATHAIEAGGGDGGQAAGNGRRAGGGRVIIGTVGSGCVELGADAVSLSLSRALDLSLSLSLSLSLCMCYEVCRRKGCVIIGAVGLGVRWLVRLTMACDYRCRRNGV